MKRTERRRGSAADLDEDWAGDREGGVVLVKLRGDRTGELLTAEIAEKSRRGRGGRRRRGEKDSDDFPWRLK
jgi:hypothetical protein